MPDESKTILVVEDEPDMAAGLQDAIEIEGYKVITTGLGKEAIGIARSTRPACVLLDLMLPDCDGLKVCEEIRSFNQSVPIIMLTAKSQEVDKLRGFKCGADDYVTKPFSVAELLVRIEAVMRRTKKAGAKAPETFKAGSSVINLRLQTVTTKGKVYQLGYYEAEILRLLYEKANQPISRDEILNRIWGIEVNPSNRTVDNFIVKLRKKIEPDPASPRLILTVYGQGYKLVL
ncbi:MAG: response regulator transcription factor [Pseudomonadota bacterium]